MKLVKYAVRILTGQEGQKVIRKQERMDLARRKCRAPGPGSQGRMPGLISYRFSCLEKNED
jgi:hypothetical protein